MSKQIINLLLKKSFSAEVQPRVDKKAVGALSKTHLVSSLNITSKFNFTFIRYLSLTQHNFIHTIKLREFPGVNTHVLPTNFVDQCIQAICDLYVQGMECQVLQMQ